MEKRHIRTIALVAMCAASNAHAQSSVTLFGMLDAGISYVSNKGGKSIWQASDGINGPNLWGLTGVEDVGGGTRAIFNLTDQFFLYSGAFVGTQSIFTRTAYVGLSNDRLGTLTLGNQYDFINDAMYATGNDPALYTGHLYGQFSGPFTGLFLPTNSNADSDWYRASGRIANSVKYNSPVYAGWSAGAMYGFGNVAGSAGTGNGSSFALNYAAGQFGANIAYSMIRYPDTAGVIGPQVELRKWGAGARYQIGTVRFSGMYEAVRNVTTGGLIYELTSGANWLVRPDFSLSASYAYVKGNAPLDNHHGHQMAAIAEYFLSKRTSVYMMGVYQRASAGADATITGTGAVSSGQNQFVGRIGMHTKF